MNKAVNQCGFTDSNVSHQNNIAVMTHFVKTMPDASHVDDFKFGFLHFGAKIFNDFFG